MPPRPKTLRLPDNHYGRLQLRWKEEEYRRRLDEPDRLYYVDSATKLFILHSLNESEHGQVATADIYAALQSCQFELWLILEKNPWMYDNACMVIADYCAGQADRIIDGTGLSDLN